MPFSKYNIGYDTKKSLENDIGALHLTSFPIEGKCTIRQPVYFYFSQQFQLPKHRFMMRRFATLSDLVFKTFSAVPTSENIESIALVCISYRL